MIGYRDKLFVRNRIVHNEVSLKIEPYESVMAINIVTLQTVPHNFRLISRVGKPVHRNTISELGIYSGRAIT